MRPGPATPQCSHHRQRTTWEDPMSEHPNVATVNSMTTAIFNQDKEALAKIFTDGLEFHLRGPWDKAGDYLGVDGFLDVLGSIMEVTAGDIQLDQLFCIGTAGWAA